MKLASKAGVCLLAGSALWGGVGRAQWSPGNESPAYSEAQQAHRAPPLRAVVDAAWRRATSAREAQAGRLHAEAVRDAVQRLWAAPPSLEIQHRDDRLQSNAGRRETEVAVAWPLWLPGQRSAQAAVAEAAVERALGSERVARLQVAGLVRESGWRFVAEASASSQLAGQVEVLHRLCQDVERRVQAGDLARADALAARAEWLSALSRLREAEQRLGEARIRWRELTGSQPDPDRASMAETLGSMDLRSDHPELEAAGQRVEYARRRLDALRTSTREPPELKFGVRQDVSGGVEGSHSSVMVGVRVPFGTQDRFRPLEAAALGDLEVARGLEQRLGERLRADAAAAQAALASLEQQLAVEQERAKLLRERADLIDRSYRAGEGALPELLRALANAAQAQAAAGRQEILREHARARLQQAIGIQP